MLTYLFILKSHLYYLDLWIYYTDLCIFFDFVIDIIVAMIDWYAPKISFEIYIYKLPKLSNQPKKIRWNFA